MSVNIRGDVFCDVCGDKIYNGIPAYSRKVGSDGYAICNKLCLEKFDIIHANAESVADDVIKGLAEREGADEQRGWALHRWWNQQYKHRRKAFDQWRADQDFKRIQRQERKRVKK